MVKLLFFISIILAKYQFLKLKDADDLIIGAEKQKSFTARGDAKQHAQKAGHMLREAHRRD